MSNLGSSARGAKRHARDGAVGKMVLDIDLNFPPVECPSERASGSRQSRVSRGARHPYHATEQQNGSAAPSSSFIDVELIEDEVVTLSSSRGFPVVIHIAWAYIMVFCYCLWRFHRSHEFCLASSVLYLNGLLDQNTLFFLFFFRFPRIFGILCCKLSCIATIFCYLNCLDLMMLGSLFLVSSWSKVYVYIVNFVFHAILLVNSLSYHYLVLS